MAISHRDKGVFDSGQQKLVGPHLLPYNDPK